MVQTMTREELEVIAVEYGLSIAAANITPNSLLELFAELKDNDDIVALKDLIDWVIIYGPEHEKLDVEGILDKYELGYLAERYNIPKANPDTKQNKSKVVSKKPKQAVNTSSIITADGGAEVVPGSSEVSGIGKIILDGIAKSTEGLIELISKTVKENAVDGEYVNVDDSEVKVSVDESEIKQATMDSIANADETIQAPLMDAFYNEADAASIFKNIEIDLESKTVKPKTENVAPKTNHHNTKTSASDKKRIDAAITESIRKYFDLSVLNQINDVESKLELLKNFDNLTKALALYNDNHRYAITKYISPSSFTAEAINKERLVYSFDDPNSMVIVFDNTIKLHQPGIYMNEYIANQN